MRTLMLLFFIVLGLNAAEVTLSALVGELKGDRMLLVGEGLHTDVPYRVGENSKVQLLLNRTAVITASQNSVFILKMLSDDSVTLLLQQGTYKIVNLANQYQHLMLLVDTPTLSMDMSDTIALVKITPKPLKAACAKHYFTAVYRDETVTTEANEMIVLEKSVLKKESVAYRDFYSVLVRYKSVDIESVHNEVVKEDPVDLEN